ncbi:hypothetical protein D3C71_1404090 [compost metagenome]
MNARSSRTLRSVAGCEDKYDHSLWAARVRVSGLPAMRCSTAKASSSRPALNKSCDRICSTLVLPG